MCPKGMRFLTKTRENLPRFFLEVLENFPSKKKRIISHKEVSKFFNLRQEPEAEVSHLQPFDFSFKTTNLTIQESHMGGQLVVIVVDSFLH